MVGGKGASRGDFNVRSWSRGAGKGERAVSMRGRAAVEPNDSSTPKGIQRIRPLPDAQLGALWDSIVLDEGLKSQLLSQAVLNFTMRGKVARSVIPLHGVILLTGVPGTGKTSLARGLAHRTAKSFP